MNNTTEQKTYVPKSSAKQITFQKSGKTIIKLGFKAEELIAFVKQHKNEKGYINLGISERREPSQYGDTHCIWLDTWKPEANQPQRMTRDRVRDGLKEAQEAAQRDFPQQDDVPF